MPWRGEARDAESSPLPKIVVFGAGALGSYVGGRLVPGAQVTLIGRSRPMAAIATHGLTVGRQEGDTTHISTEDGRLTATSDYAAVEEADLVLLTVRAADTIPAAEILRRRLRPGVGVVTLASGVRNVARLEEFLEPHTPAVLGVGSFHVSAASAARISQVMSGELYVQDHPAVAPLLRASRGSVLPVQAHRDLRPIQNGRLLLTLNAAVNALSGLPLAEEFADRSFRRALALVYEEGVRVLRAAGEPFDTLTPHSAATALRLLRAPQSVFSSISRTTLGLRFTGYSRMSLDLAAGRATEVDEMQGEFVRMAERSGQRAPVNTFLLEQVRAAERAGPDHRPRWSGPDLLAVLTDLAR